MADAGRITHGPLFRRVTGQGKSVGADRLNDQEVMRLVKRTALAAGVRGDLTERERALKFSGSVAARRTCVFCGGRRALCAKQLEYSSDEMTRNY